MNDVCKLHKFYGKSAESLVQLSASLMNPTAYQFPIPTEIVLTVGKTPVMRMGRVYYSDFVEVKDEESGTTKIMLRSEVNAQFGVVGESNRFKSWHTLSLVEIWDDYGDDGHTDYELVGWGVFISEDEVWRYIEKLGRGERPYVEVVEPVAE